MNNFLNTLAVESGVVDAVEEHAGSPEEITIATMDTETELEEVVEQVAKDTESASTANAGVDQLVETMVSLEAKVIMLREMRSSGESLNAQAAKMYSSSIVLSLEARGFPEALYADLVSDMNHSFESHSAYDYSTEAEEKSEGVMTRIKNMLKSALDGFIRFWKDLMGRIGTIGKSIIGLGDSLIKRAGTLGDKVLTKDKISTKGILLATDKPAAILATLTKAAPAVSKLETDIAKFVGEVAKKNLESLRGPAEPVQIQEFSASVPDLGNGFDLDYSDTPSIKGEGTFKGTDVAPLSQTEIRDVGVAIISLGKAIAVSDSEQRALITSLENSINTIVGGFKGEVKAGAADVSKQFTKGIKLIRGGRTQFNSHATKVAKQAYRLGVLSANRHGAAA